MSRHLLFSAVLLLCSSVFAQKVPIRELAQHSAEITTLIAPNSLPFHLKATVSDVTGSARQGVMEEYWVSPTKWRRTIQFPPFSQTTIVNGATRYEKNEGDYFPTILRMLTEAILQPIPDKLQQALKQSQVKLNFFPGSSDKVNYCDSNQVNTGTAPAENTVLIAVCFSGDPANSSISSIVMPGYNVEFKDRQPFGKLLVARHLISDSSTKTKWEAQVTELSAITEPDESLFAMPENTPESQRLRVFQVDEHEARAHFTKLPELIWPSVHEGKTSGVVTIFVSIDKDGNVREAWPLNSGNNEVSTAACEQMLKWSFGARPQPGEFIQLETFFTFHFQTQLVKDESAKPVPSASGPRP